MEDFLEEFFSQKLKKFISYWNKFAVIYEIEDVY